MPPPTDHERRARILGEAKALLENAKGKTWEQLAAEKDRETIFAEPLTDKELFKSPMSYPFRLPRSRSADFSATSRESYLSRWSRENTPVDNVGRYARNVRRSYTPVRDVAAVKGSSFISNPNLEDSEGEEEEGPLPKRARTIIEDDRRPYSSYRNREPIGLMTLPYTTQINYAAEEEPIRKYDVFQVRTWSYPIYKYLNHREHSYERPYSYSRTYANTPSYTPPQLTVDSRSRIDGKRGYSGYGYLASESHFDITARPRSLTNNNYWRSHYASTPWYTNYYGSSALRHFNSYRPRNFTSTNTYWKPYY